MAFNPKDKADIKKQYEYTDNIISSFYDSSEYIKFVARYEARLNAYYMRNTSKNANWRSKLHLATFLLSVKALTAQQFAQHKQEPFIHIGVNDNAARDEDAEMFAQKAHFDLQYDLKNGLFKPKLFDLYWYTDLVGTACAREFIRSEQKTAARAGREIDEFGNDLGVLEQEQIQRKEFTVTQVIHPCNFAHDLTKKDFTQSEWGSVRFKLGINEIYRMLNHPHYHQPGVKKAIKHIEEGEIGSEDISSVNFYEDGGLTSNYNDSIVVEEYSGPLKFSSNRDDMKLYYGLYIRRWNITLRVGESQFKRHPYWKMMPYPDPNKPYGLGPNDPVLPINYWENNTVNRFNDYMNVVSKFMYMVKPDHITGGLDSLLNGYPLGVLPIEENAPLNDVFGKVPADYQGVQMLSGAMDLIERYKQQQGMSSNLRGQSSDQLNDTATGISLIAQREDEFTEAMQASIDIGITDGMQIKLSHRADFFSEPIEGEIEVNGEIQAVTYFPYELKGRDFSFDVNRRLADNEAGKHLNYVKLLGFIDNKLQQSGQSLPTDLVLDALEKAGQALNINGIDEDIKKVREMQPPAPQLQGPVESGAPLEAQGVQAPLPMAAGAMA